MKEKKKESFPRTLTQAIRVFPKAENGLRFMVSMRWPDGKVKCPTCGSDEVSFLCTRNVWKCKNAHTKQQFSVKVGTIMEDSPIELENWMAAFWLIANCKNGISSYELTKDLGVTQKTAWFLLHRIQLAMQDEGVRIFAVRVALQQPHIDGTPRNIHKS